LPDDFQVDQTKGIYLTAFIFGNKVVGGFDVFVVAMITTVKNRFNWYPYLKICFAIALPRPPAAPVTVRVPLDSIEVTSAKYTRCGICLEIRLVDLLTFHCKHVMIDTRSLGCERFDDDCGWRTGRLVLIGACFICELLCRTFNLHGMFCNRNRF
jgi:hypothetical protein